MAEDIRNEDPDPRSIEVRRQEDIYKECKRQEESCLYISTHLITPMLPLR